MPLYFFWGEEDYLIEKEVKALKKKILGESFDALNYRVLDNPDFSAFDEALRTSPMFFGDILYIIKADKYFLETKGKIKLDETQVSMLCESFKNIAQGVHVVLLCPIERGEKKKPDSRDKNTEGTHLPANKPRQGDMSLPLFHYLLAVRCHLSAHKVPSPVAMRVSKRPAASGDTVILPPSGKDACIVPSSLKRNISVVLPSTTCDHESVLLSYRNFIISPSGFFISYPFLSVVTA